MCSWNLSAISMHPGTALDARGRKSASRSLSRPVGQRPRSTVACGRWNASGARATPPRRCSRPRCPTLATPSPQWRRSPASHTERRVADATLRPSRTRFPTRSPCSVAATSRPSTSQRWYPCSEGPASTNSSPPHPKRLPKTSPARSSSSGWPGHMVTTPPNANTPNDGCDSSTAPKASRSTARRRRTWALPTSSASAARSRSRSTSSRKTAARSFSRW